MAENVQGLRIRESENYTIILGQGRRIDTEDRNTGATYGILLFDQDLQYDENEVEDIAPVNGVDHPVRETRRRFYTERNYIDVIRTRILVGQNDNILQEDYTLTIGELGPERRIFNIPVTSELFDLFEAFHAEPQPQDGGRHQRYRKIHKRHTRKQKRNRKRNHKRKTHKRNH